MTRSAPSLLPWAALQGRGGEGWEGAVHSTGVFFTHTHTAGGVKAAKGVCWLQLVFPKTRERDTGMGGGGRLWHQAAWARSRDQPRSPAASSPVPISHALLGAVSCAQTPTPAKPPCPGG